MAIGYQYNPRPGMTLWSPTQLPLSNPMTPAAGASSMPPPLVSGLQVGGADVNVGAIAGGLCGLIPNKAARLACEAVAGAVTVAGNQSTPGRGTDSSATGYVPLATTGATNCPAGYVSDGKGGCRIQGLGSYLPGDVGMPDTGWTPMAGMYGVGVSPLPVQRVVRACPTGFVLGKDGVCYDHLARSNREHNPGRKPLLTGGDMNALSRARQLQKTIGKINTRFGPKKRISHSHASHHGKK